MKGKRNIAVEMLRCLFMAMIVMDHCYEHGIFASNQGSLHFCFRSMLLWHVPGFIAISGWFGIKFCWRKFINLWALMAFYSVLSVVVHLISPSTFPNVIYTVQGGWFGGSYLMLMCIAPLLNAGLDALKDKGRKELLTAWSIFAFGMLVTWLPFHGMLCVNGVGFIGSTSAMMIFVYCTARTFRLLELNTRSAPVMLSVAIGGYVLLTICAEYLWRNGIGGEWSRDKMLTYSAPWVWALPIVLIMTTGRLTSVGTSSRIYGLIECVSPSLFGVYLFHDATSFGRVIIRECETFLVNSFGLGASMSICVTTLVVVVSGLSFDFCRRGLQSLIRKVWRHLC